MKLFEFSWESFYLYHPTSRVGAGSAYVVADNESKARNIVANEIGIEPDKLKLDEVCQVGEVIRVDHSSYYY